MVYRIYVEKKPGFDVEANGLKNELTSLLGIKDLTGLRLLNRYDVEGIDEALFNQCVSTVFSEPPVDNTYAELPAAEGVSFAVEYLPGQFDQRAASAAECIQLISQGERPLVRSARVYLLEGTLTDEQVAEIKKYVINPVECREASLDLPESLAAEAAVPSDVETVTGFTALDRAGLEALLAREHLNRRTLSLKTGIPYTTIDNWYKRSYEGLKLSTAGKLASFFGTTTDYFLREELTDPDYGKTAGFQVEFSEMGLLQKYRALDTYGKKAVEAVLDTEHDRMTHTAQREQKGWITYITCYDLAVSAGTGEPLGDTYYTTKLEIPTQRVPENAHCCLRVNGDSMEPAYKDGDIVFIQRVEDGALREGEVGIFALNGEGYIKQLGHRQLLSFNPKYPPIAVGAYDRLECQGRVLGKL